MGGLRLPNKQNSSTEKPISLTQSLTQGVGINEEELLYTHEETKEQFSKGNKNKNDNNDLLYEQEDQAPESKAASKGGNKKKRKGKAGKTLTECFPIDKLRSITKQLAAKKTKKTKWEKKKTQRQLFAQNLVAQEKV